jgi:hypothetical protein
MGVHKKLTQARIALQAAPLKKSGHNKFAGYQYFELSDFLPTINTIFYNLGLCSVISFDKDLATMCITDTDDGSQLVLTAPMAEANLKGCHPIQNLGAVISYIRRYLYVSALEICEHDAIDASAPLKEEKQAPIITPTQGAMDNIPPEEVQYLQEMAVDLIAMCEQGDPKAAWVKLEEENLDAEQKIALWTLLPSKVRSALKNAKG